ncbi:MAG: IclR family transcriptional regulator [Chloroflexota bacterium]
MSEIQSVQRAFEILNAVAQVPHGAQLGDIAELTGLPKSTISRMLTTLEKIAAVKREHPKAGFQIGPAIAALIAQPSWLVSLAEQPLRRLVEETGETATLSIMDGERLLYIAQKSDPNSNIQLRDWTGIHFPTLHVLSPSKIFLAYDSTLRQRYLTKPLERFTENSIVERERLVIQLDHICQHGYAWVREEFERGLAGVSAPIFGQTGKIVAALSLYGPVFRVPSEENEHLFSDLVVKVAAEMSAQIGGKKV